MARWPVFVALAVVATMVLTFGAGVSAGAVAAPSSAHAGVRDATHPTLSFDWIEATDSDGYGVSSYQVGLQSGHVYFYVYDPDDSQVNVTITDQNASRDGVSSPAAKFILDTPGPSHYNYSSEWNIYYELPLTLTDCGWWNLTVSGAKGGVYNASFFVETYYVSLDENSEIYLPGQVALLTWQVDSTVNGAPVSGWISSIQYTGWYYNRTDVPRPLFVGSQSAAAAETGNISISVPTDMPADGGYLYFILYANQTAGGGKATVLSYYDIDVGHLAWWGSSLGSCASGCSGDDFTDHGLAFVSVTVGIEGTYGEIPAVGLDSRIWFRNASGNVSSSLVPGAPTNPSTNGTGSIGFVFQANNPPFSSSSVNVYWINVTDPLDPGVSLQKDWGFYVQPATPGSVNIQIGLGQPRYYSGQEVNGTWTLAGNTSTALNGWQVTSWYVYSESTDGLLDSGIINTTARTGAIHWSPPSWFTGYFWVYVEAANKTSSTDGYVEGLVAAPVILLNPSSTTYAPGNTIKVTVELLGGLSGTTLWGAVAEDDEGGSNFWSGQITNNLIALAIPSVDPPEDLEVSVVADSASGVVVATAEVDLSEAEGFALTAGIATVSSYEDGSFQPGQTIQIHYQITNSSTAPLPTAFWIAVEIPGSVVGSAETWEEQSASGDVSFTIPSTMANGNQLIFVEVSGIGCAPSAGGCSQDVYVSVLINSSPPALSYTLGAGTGLTLGWLILIILLVIVAIVLLVIMRGRKRPVMMSPASGGMAPMGSPGGGGMPPTSGGGPTGGPSGGGSPPPPGASGSTPSSGWSGSSDSSANPPMPR